MAVAQLYSLGIAMPTRYKIYLTVYVLLAVWFTIASLRITEAFSFWTPAALIMVLDFIYTRDSRWRFVLAGMFMIPIVIFACIQILAPRADYQRFIYRVYETIPFVIALVLYQFLFYRFTVRRRDDA